MVLVMLLTGADAAMDGADVLMVEGRVTLLTGADAVMDGADVLMVEGRVVLEDEDDEEDWGVLGGGPASAAVTSDVEVEGGELDDAATEDAFAGMEILGTGAEGGSTEYTVLTETASE